MFAEEQYDLGVMYIDPRDAVDLVDEIVRLRMELSMIATIARRAQELQKEKDQDAGKEMSGAAASLGLLADSAERPLKPESSRLREDFPGGDGAQDSIFDPFALAALRTFEAGQRLKEAQNQVKGAMDRQKNENEELRWKLEEAQDEIARLSRENDGETGSP